MDIATQYIRPRKEVTQRIVCLTSAEYAQNRIRNQEKETNTNKLRKHRIAVSERTLQKPISENVRRRVLLACRLLMRETLWAPAAGTWSIT